MALGNERGGGRRSVLPATSVALLYTPSGVAEAPTTREFLKQQCATMCCYDSVRVPAAARNTLLHIAPLPTTEHVLCGACMCLPQPYAREDQSYGAKEVEHPRGARMAPNVPAGGYS